jgi:hypothetical protein
MKKLTAMILISGLSFCLSACGGDGTECGPGTTDQNGTCVPDILECGDGTVLQDDQCVPICGTDQYWDGTQCVNTPECAAGTTFNSQTGECEPCPQGQYWNGTACQIVPECDDGTTFNAATGKCEPDAEACGPGTVFINGQCVPEELPDPDVVESTDPVGEAPFNLPAAGQSVSLGGVVDEPTDLDGDGWADADWDAFTVTVPAGTYLRIRATSEGAALPAFMVLSGELDDLGYALYARYAINPNGLECEREVYLPRADTYTILVSDYNNMVTALFGAGAYPVGGDDFSYYVTVENLGAPAITDIDTMPLSDLGQIGDGQLYFYNLKNLSVADVITLRSLGEPLPDTLNDAFPLIVLVAPDGTILEQYATNPAADAEILFAAWADGDYLVVQDHLLVIGPLDDFEISGVNETVEDCTAGGCAGGALAEGEHRVLKWDLLTGDFFLFNATVPSGATENLRVALYDNGMNVISEASAGATWNRWDDLFVTQDTWIYLWLEGWTGGAVPAYTLEVVHEATPELLDGVAAAGLAVTDMPASTLLDSGIDHFVGGVGQVAVFLDFATHGAGWTSPQEEIYTELRGYLGPAFDTVAADLPVLDPPIAYMPGDGYYLHIVSDPGSDITAGTYDTTLYLQDLSDLGAPAAGSPVGVAGQTLDAGTGLAFYTYGAVTGENAGITVTPNGANLRPEVWVLEFGYHYQTSWYSRAAYNELGRKASATAQSAGQAATVEHVSSYGGPIVVVVRDASGSGGGDTFDVDVSVIP